MRDATLLELMSHIVSYQCECLKIENIQIAPEDHSGNILGLTTTIFRRKHILLRTKAFRFPWANDQYLNKISCSASSWAKFEKSKTLLIKGELK